MFTLTDEIAAARYHKKHMRQSGPLEHEHAIHAFVFLSFLFAEAIKLIIETWVRVKDSRAEVVLLLAITLLGVQYWWVIYESAFFYGKNIVNFSCGTLEAALFYAVTYLLRESHSLRWPFFVFAAMVLSFIFVDWLKYIENVPRDQRKIGHLAPRQLFRLLAIIAAFLGGFEYVNPLAVSSFLLLLVVVYTGLTSYAHWIATPRSGSKRAQGGPAA